VDGWTSDQVVCQRANCDLRYYCWSDRIEEDAQAFFNMFLNQQAETSRRMFPMALRGSAYR
jgi:hypothetical protein